jgi:hypothetical protein
MLVAPVELRQPESVPRSSAERQKSNSNQIICSMNIQPVLKISKLDVAKRQLETAIRLWFHSVDPVSVHTVAAASHQILHDLGKRHGKSTALRSLREVRPEFRKKTAKAISRCENFFKHADRDPDELLNFDPEVTLYYLLDAVVTYEALTKEQVPIFGVLKSWAFIQYPEAMEEKSRNAFLLQIEASDAETKSKLCMMSKLEFLHSWLPILLRIETV